jgi:nitroimidazol reductase NimA-like FMN-containing flavoprotein (pyridoxamine 5'-phosphate oxidase superfamily)
MSEAGNPPIQMMLDEIERDECLELLATQSIGRLAVPDHGYYPPHIVPVNFALDDDKVVFRSDSGLKFKLSILAEHSVSFEVDSIDRAGRMAWSVVVQGRAELLNWEEVKGRDYESAVQPWAPGDKPQWIRIVPYTITGRRLRAVASSPAMLDQ